MAQVKIDWEDGAELKPHTEKKHRILREYFRQYLVTRCKIPRREKLRLVIVDGFAGGGLYACGSYGSPLIFVDTLIKTIEEINIDRASQGLKSIEIECLLILNDLDPSVIEQLKQNLAPLIAKTKENGSKLRLGVEYLSEEFDKAYPQIKKRVQQTKCGNVLFNLDQCGHSKVNPSIIRDIMQIWANAEAFLNFPINTILTFISPEQEKNSVLLPPEILKSIYEFIKDGNEAISKREWLGHVEQIVFGNLKSSAPYVSPFSIHNPEGWGYWLMHFANSHRARQVYNDILHENSNAQAHFGRSGLDMLSYNPAHDDGQPYLFDVDSRKSAKNALYNDIPQVIEASGDALTMEDFYRVAYSATPAHSDDIHEMIIENPDVEVITETGGERRVPNIIKTSDVLKFKKQKSMLSMFSQNEN